MITPKNLIEKIPAFLTEEWVEVLAEGSGNFKIERIVSPPGHSSPSPPDSWYDQDTSEWVMLVKGTAQLKFAEPEQTVELQMGDWLEIPPHCRHRVESTSASEETIWLAIHWD